MKKRNYPIMLRAARSTLLLAAVCGGLASCTDDYELDDDGVSPGYVSIYALLQNPEQLSDQEHHLTGTFSYYLRLADDLGYADVFNRTGSKTVFPANDEAFEHFFHDNPWGISSYEQLSMTQKKQLLYGSMIDNALLTGMLSNIQNGGTVSRGQAMRHNTAISITDTITHYTEDSQLPQNNAYWDKFREDGIYYVADATKPSMVHFTREHMLQNGITVSGANSDFEVITGAPYDEQVSTYIFRNPVINRDVRALNGYVHQVRDVLVPQPNIAEVIRTSGESNYFSRMLDRFSVPLYDALDTRNYNDYAQASNLPLIDSIYQKRYFNSYDGLYIDDATNLGIRIKEWLDFDPGHNSYAPANKNEQADMCAIFVPTDQAMEEYFLPGGGGAFLLQQYGKKENTRENLMENIDSIPLNLVSKLVKNLMKPSFIESVPSKFGTVLNDATEPMGLSLDLLNRNADGTYDVKIANNGVAYMMNSVIAPDDYQCVYAPATILQDMLIMRKAIEDGSSGNTYLNLDLNFYAYLKAMRANYALFIPKDAAFQSGQYYVDPTYINNTRQPRVLKFFIDENQNVACSSWRLNPLTMEIGDSIAELTPAQFKTQLTDILNYSTIVLPNGVTLESSGNRYFKTKHGGELFFDRTTVRAGGQVDNGLDVSTIIETYPEKNGTAYIVDRVLQVPQKSVYSVLTDSINHPQFSDFFALCTDSRTDRLLQWAAPEKYKGTTETGKDKTDPMHPFIDKNGLTPNVNYFSSYNYTVYMPNNTAMAQARSLGLPTWDDVYRLYNRWDGLTETEIDNIMGADSLMQVDKDKALAMMNQINSFIRYHIQNNAIYADHQVMSDNLTPVSTTIGDEFATAYANLLGIRMKLNLKGGENQFTVTDAAGNQVVISEQSGLMVNQMARDYVFDAISTQASSISTSSFAVVHEISRPLVFEPSGRFDDAWTASDSTRRLSRVRTLFNENYNKRY